MQMAVPRNEHSPSLARFFKEMSALTPLTQERERLLASRRDANARDELVRANLSFVAMIAREYRSHGVPYEDLLHEGAVGLTEAARRFDGKKGVKFITYARWWIRKEILRAVSEQSSLVSIPDHRKRLLRRLHLERTSLQSKLGRRLTWEEVSALSSRTPGEVDRIREAEHIPVWLDHSREADGKPALVERIADPRVESAEKELIRNELRERVEDALGSLTQRQRRILASRFGLDGERAMTLREIGAREGISRERTRQIEHDSLIRLSKLMLRKSRERGGPRARLGPRANGRRQAVERRAS
jgi:RNA polymerase primary sigma factor